MLPPILAQVSPPPASLASWLEVFFYLSTGTGGCLLAWNQYLKLRGRGQPLEIKPHPGVASDDDLHEVHGRIKRERAEIDAAIAELKAEDRRLREKLDQEIQGVRDAIDILPERVINLLRGTKGLL